MHSLILLIRRCIVCLHVGVSVSHIHDQSSCGSCSTVDSVSSFGSHAVLSLVLASPQARTPGTLVRTRHSAIMLAMAIKVPTGLGTI